MKKILFLVIIFSGITVGQNVSVFTNDSLRNSHIDTSDVINNVPMFKQIRGYFASNDSTNGILFIDYKMANSYLSWSTASPETITVASSTGAGYGTNIRSNFGDKVPGAHILRFRFQTLASGNNTQAALKRYSFSIEIEK